MLAIVQARPLANRHSNTYFCILNLQIMKLRKLLASRKSQKALKQPEENNGELHMNFRSTVRQLVVVRSCLNEDGEASIDLPPDSPASDGEEEEGGQCESEALNAAAVLLVRGNQVVSVALDVARASTSGSSSSTHKRTGCGSSGLSNSLSYRLTIFVSGGLDQTKMGGPSSSQTGPIQGCKALHPSKTSKAERQPSGVGAFGTVWEKASKLNLRERWSATLKQSTSFFVTLNSSHEVQEHGFHLLGPVELPEGKSWLSAIMEAPPDLEWVVLE